MGLWSWTAAGWVMKRETWLPAEASSARLARSIVREAAAEVDLDGERAWDLTLATTEAVANAIQHGKAWPNDCILLTVQACSRGLRVEVCDCGTFDSTLEPAPLNSTSGRGMQIIATLVDRIEVQHGDGRTLVRFEKHRLEACPSDAATVRLAMFEPGVDTAPGSQVAADAV